MALAAATSAICRVPSLGFPCCEEFLWRGLEMVMEADEEEVLLAPLVVLLLLFLEDILLN